MRSHYILQAAAFSAFFGLISVPLERPAAAQNSAQSAKLPDIVQSNEELQKFYLQSPPAQMRTPRASDGHPDLNGFWYNDLGNLGTRDANGSVKFDLGGARDRSKPPRKYPEPSEPSYKPEYAAKVKAIVESQYGPHDHGRPQF